MCCNLSVFGQEFTNLWTGHFSFFEVIDVIASSEKVYAASENAVFSYDLFTNETETITTIDGLSGQRISTLGYSSDKAIILIGYENGLIELYFEDTQQVFSVVDILERENITPVNRRINYFFEFDNRVYIATNYGISVYDLERLEFGDTYFLGNGGAQVIVNQVTVLNGQIFAACLNNNGIKTGTIDNPNLINFEEWQTIDSGNFITINTLSNEVYAIGTNRQLRRVFPGPPSSILTVPTTVLDSEVSEESMTITTSTNVVVYNSNINQVATFEPNEDFDTSFNASYSIGNDIFIATEDLGVLNNLISSPGDYVSIVPNGPLKNSPFRIDAETGVVWVTYGQFTQALNPFPLNSEGLSYLREEEWNNIPFDSLLGARELNKITPNPLNPNQVFISSFKDGLLELNDFKAVELYDETNSTIESIEIPANPNFRGYRVSCGAFDDDGSIWTMTSRVGNALNAYNINLNSWNSFDFTNLIGDPFSGEDGYFDLEIDPLGTKWIGAYDNGLIAYNENKSDPIKNISTEEQNIPIARVTALALDTRNQLWVGTIFGLRVLFNTAGFFEDSSPRLNSIIILEDGIPKELLQDQYITDIEVDGSNNKWVGTVDSGIFYFTPNGQETIYHFTTDNSPLPSNAINDISIDLSNGEVYIATDRGLLSFKAGGSAPESDLNEAYVYPNPVRPEYDILGFNNLNDITKGIKIVGLTEDVNIKITDVEGNLVAEAQSRVNLRSSTANYNFAIDGGTAVWNGRNLANNIVSSGVYVIMIYDLDSFETKVLKLLIIR